MAKVQFLYQPGYLASANTQAGNQARNQAAAATILSKILEAGLVQTADTGQYDPSVTLFPPVSGYGATAYAGYWVFEMQDALSDDKRCFIRMDLYAGDVSTSAGTAADIWIDVSMGTGTDGAGVLSQSIQVSQSRRGSYISSSMSAQYGGCISVEPGLFKMALGLGGNVVPSSYGSNYALNCLAMISRTRNPDGQPNAKGLYAIGVQSAPDSSVYRSLRGSAIIGAAAGVTSRELVSAVGVQVATGALEGVVQVQFPYVLNPELKTTYEFAYTVTPIAADEFVTVDVGGMPVRYLSLGNASDSPSNCFGENVSWKGSGTPALYGMTLLLRWDEEE